MAKCKALTGSAVKGLRHVNVDSHQCLPDCRGGRLATDEVDLRQVQLLGGLTGLEPCLMKDK